MTSLTNSDDHARRRSPAERRTSIRPFGRAFTLIELLVVIAIIAILAGLLLPVVSKVMINAQKTAAKNTELQIVGAIKNFKTEYGTYPLPAGTSTTEDACFGINAPTNADLFHILQADNLGSEQNVSTRINTRGIVYIQLPMAKNQTQDQSKNGIGPDGMLYDPWGRIYLIGVDAPYAGTVNNPYSKDAGSVPFLRTGVIVYSWGPDRLTTSAFYGNAGGKNDPTSMDDVISWQ